MDHVRKLQPYLLNGERILWSGKPKQGIVLQPKVALLIPFSLLWGGFAILWNAMVWLHPTFSSDGAPDWIFRLWGMPFLLVGLYMIGGRFLHDAHLRKALAYAVTDQRVLILRGSKLTSLEIDRLPRLDLLERNDGTGSIQFDGSGDAIWNNMNGMGWWVPSLNASARFFRIVEPRYVYELIRQQGRR